MKKNLLPVTHRVRTFIVRVIEESSSTEELRGSVQPVGDARASTFQTRQEFLDLLQELRKPKGNAAR